MVHIKLTFMLQVQVCTKAHDQTVWFCSTSKQHPQKLTYSKMHTDNTISTSLVLSKCYFLLKNFCVQMTVHFLPLSLDTTGDGYRKSRAVTLTMNV